MSWKESNAMSERVMLMNEWLKGEYGIAELARAYGVSRKTVYKWIGRYEAGSWEGLKDRSRAPHHHGKAVGEEMELLVLALKEQRPLWGAPKLHTKLLEAVGEELCPAESTVSAVLRRHGLSRTAKRRRRAVPSASPLSHCQSANAVWCADFKGWFRTADGKRCDPLTISDAYSRYLLKCQGLGERTETLTVKPLFIAAFREHGMPLAIRTDNGTPFASTGLGGLSRLSVWWMRLGMELERIEPGKPQQNGRHERMHRTLKEATAKPPRANLRRQQEAFDDFRQEYNEERPHEALGQRTPAEHYEPSPRNYPERLPAQRGYPQEWEKRMVRISGQMKWKGKEIVVTKALAGHEIGLEPVGDGQWAVHFENTRLGIFDERKGRIKPAKTLENGSQTPVSTE